MTLNPLAGFTLPDLTHLNQQFEQRTSAMIAMAETHRIELASILLLFILPFLIFFLFYTEPLFLPGNKDKEFSNLENSADITQGRVRDNTLKDGVAGHQLRYAETHEHHIIAKVGKRSLQVLETQHFAKEQGVGKEIEARPLELRRSGRARRPTRRFEESGLGWRMKDLRTALGEGF